MKKFFLLITFVLLISIAYSKSEKICNSLDVDMKTSYKDHGLYQYVLILITIQLVVAALAYMYAGVTMSAELKAWGRNEIMQAIFSLILIATYFALITTVGNYIAGAVSTLETDDHISIAKNACFNNENYRWSVVDSNCPNGYSTLSSPEDKMFYVSRAYLGLTYERLGEILNAALKKLLIYGAVDSYSQTIGVDINQLDFGGVSFSFGFPMHAVMNTILKNISDIVTKLLMAIKFQEAILIIVNEGGLGERILILGIMFRCIWFLRKAGGLMIALGIGLMFVLPFLYMLGWYTIDINPFKGIFDKGSMIRNNKDFGDKVKLEIVSGVFGATLGTAATLIAVGLANPFSIGGKLSIPLIALDAFYVSTFGSILTYAGFNLDGLNAQNLYTDLAKPGKGIGYFDMISRYLLVALALPLLNLYFLLSFVRGLSPLLGGDHTIPGIARLI